jgi:CsbD-like.
MNWDRVEGQWKQRRGKAVQHWGKLMNDDLAAIAGKHEQLVGTLQEKYGIAKEEAKRQVDESKKIVEQLKKSNANLLRMRSQKSLRKKKKKSNGISVKAKTSSKR